MKILIHGINFSPELTGIGKYTGDMAGYLAQNGDEVTVFTGVPYYPHWKIPAGYRNFWKMECHPDIRIYRAPLYVPDRICLLKRIFQELTFIISSIPFWILAVFRKFDVVIVVCPPIMLCIIPLLLQKFKRFRLVCHIQDLQIDTAIQLVDRRPKRRLGRIAGAAEILPRTE